jgi:hypothetical protein
LIRIEMAMGVVDDFKQQLTLPCEPDSMRLQRRSRWRFSWQNQRLRTPIILP